MSYPSLRWAFRVRGLTPGAIVRRLVRFWLVWSALLLIHEGGHALVAHAESLPVRRVTVGVGPVVWRTEVAGVDAVLRLVPLAGVTRIGTSSVAPTAAAARSPLRALAGGTLATVAAGLLLLAGIALRERRTRARWTGARYLLADVAVLTLFNFLPVPPLDGGRLMLAGVTTWYGRVPSSDALFWLQAGGLALAILPMTVWTRWTLSIDRLALRIGAPVPTQSGLPRC